MESLEVIVVGCTSDHGGVVTSGSDNVMYCNQPVSRIGDSHMCPEHGVSQIVSTPQDHYYVNKQLVAVDGAEAGCGAIIYGCCERTVLSKPK